MVQRLAAVHLCALRLYSVRGNPLARYRGFLPEGNSGASGRTSQRFEAEGVMGTTTKIQWCEATWEPITGCTKVSAGCADCYAIRLAGGRLQHHRHYADLTQITNGRLNWTGEVRFNEDILNQPLRWKKGRRIFVCSRGDLFHEKVREEWLDRIFAVMALCPQHTFILLTKRPERMQSYLMGTGLMARWGWEATAIIHRQQGLDLERANEAADEAIKREPVFPLPNVWAGVGAEDQATADERIPILLQVPAAVRWASLEPLLGHVDLDRGGFTLLEPVRSPSGTKWYGLNTGVAGARSYCGGGTNVRNPCSVLAAGAECADGRFIATAAIQ